jgi:hypothetical protein
MARCGIVPASAIRKTGRMDAGFYLQPGGEQEARAAKCELQAAKKLAEAERLREEARQEREKFAALGVVVR